MKRVIFHFFVCFFVLSLFCCSQDKPGKTEVLCRINDYDLTLDEFQYQLATELELDSDFKLTEDARQAFLEELIRKELLIQEAKRLKLDREAKFVKAIERYWESTLIRDMIDLKSKGINERIFVSQEEIEARYKEVKESGEMLPPLKEIEERITNELKEQKKTGMLEKWISDLRKNAAIEIDKELLCGN